jgi:hypothetical protein
LARTANPLISLFGNILALAITDIVLGGGAILFIDFVLAVPFIAVLLTLKTFVGRGRTFAVAWVWIGACGFF